MRWFEKARELSPEELAAQMAQINELIDNDCYKQAYRAAAALERCAPGYGAYWLGCCHQMGWGVPQDDGRALAYYRKTVQYVQDEACLAFAWYMGGRLQMDLHGSQDEPIRWLRNAVEAGAEEAAPLLGQCCTIKAMQAGGAAAKARRPEERARQSAVAIEYAVFGQDVFLEEIRKDTRMGDEYYIYLGECARLLYMLGCRGDFLPDGIEDERVRQHVSEALGLEPGQEPEKTEKKLRANATEACAALDRCGKELAAEYFRALCDLAECEYHQSAPALYRACWHIKRIGELRAAAQPEALETIDAYADDPGPEYERLNAVYGGEVTDMIQVADLPELAPDYPAFKAPAPQSCGAFMRYVEQVKKLPPPAEAAPTPKKRRPGAK